MTNNGFRYGAVRAGAVALTVTLVLLFTGAPPSFAQEFSVHGGALANVDTADTSYSWMLQYRQPLGKHFSMTIAWLNEGHPTNHHRDGYVIQAWSSRRFSRKLTGGVGLGVERFFDTTELPGKPGSTDLHGYAAIASLGLSYDLGPRWAARATLNRTWSEDERSIDTSALLFGIAYRFVDDKTADDDIAAPHGRTTGSEAMAFVGKTIVNTFESEKAVAAGVELRHGIGKNMDMTISLINEGDPTITRRTGLATQVWLVNAVMDKKLTFGAGGGVYIYLDQNQTTEDGQQAGRSWAGIVTVGASWRFSDSWYTRLNWNRIVTDYDRDSDVIVIGVGYRWHNE